jgi:sugar diacid utilization regulator
MCLSWLQFGPMDGPKLQLLELLERRLDLSVDEAARALAAQTDAFGPIHDAALPEELRQLARQHWLTFLETARAERTPGTDEYDFARSRAVQRARELVPLAAQVRAYLVGIRAVMDTIAQQAGTGGASRGAALELIGHLMDSVVVAFSTMVEAYVETAQGEHADREADRWALLDEIIAAGDDVRSELSRRAAGLALEPSHGQVVVLARVLSSSDPDAGTLARRWGAEAIARATGRAATRTFLVVRKHDVVGVLDAVGEHRAQLVLDRARRALSDRGGALLTAGIGTPFYDLKDLHHSYREAQRALRHVDSGCPIISSPQDISLFNDLTVSADVTTRGLIPDETRRALQDPLLLSTLRAYIDADLNVTATAQTLILHPNSVRYRLRRIAELTGRDPHKLKDLFELATAARMLDDRVGEEDAGRG